MLCRYDCTDISEYVLLDWLVVDVHYLKKIPKQGSPMKREDVLFAGVQRCLMCVILSSVVQTEDTDSNLVDKEIILSFYQVRSRTFYRAVWSFPNYSSWIYVFQLFKICVSTYIIIGVGTVDYSN